MHQPSLLITAKMKKIFRKYKNDKFFPKQTKLTNISKQASF
jgi:hypothetical protein